MDREAWQASPKGHKELDTTEQPNTHQHYPFYSTLLPEIEAFKAYLWPSRGSVVKNPPANAEDVSLIPGLGRDPGEGNGSPLQSPCLGNPWMEEPSALQSMGHKESDMTQ